jgi:hypothetical protein
MRTIVPDIRTGLRAAALIFALVCLAVPGRAASYEELVAQAKQGGSVDYAALRAAYADSQSYDPYNTAIATLRGPMQKAFAESDCESAIRQGEAILEKNYVFIDAHVILDTCHRRLGQTVPSERHKAVARGLIRAILSSGDGKTPETAFAVISVSEEYTIIGVRGARRVQQALINKDGHAYDLMTVQNRSGEKEQLYFNIDRVMRWSAEKFGGKK